MSLPDKAMKLKDGKILYDNLRSMVAVNFDQATANEAGSYVCYQGAVYHLPDGHTAGTTWANTTKVGPTNIGSEVSTLKSAFDYSLKKAADVSLWALGAISSSTGDNTESTTRMRTEYLKGNIVGVKPGTGYKFILFAFKKSDSTYVGAWNGSTFEASATWFENSVMISALGHHEYKYRLVAANTSNTNLTIATDAQGIILHYQTDDKLNTEGIAADALKVKEEIDIFSNDIKNIADNTLKVSEEEWYTGFQVDQYTSSTFSGFATSWATTEEKYIKSLTFKVKSRDESNITVIAWRIECGSFALERQVSVNIGSTMESVTVDVNAVVPAGTVWVGIAANKKATFKHASTTGFNYHYWVNGDISTLSQLKVSGGSSCRLYLVANCYRTDETSDVKIKAPDVYDLVVGDTFQLFKKGIISAVNTDAFDIQFNCSKGNAYKNMFEITPLTDENLTLQMTLYDAFHNTIDSKNVTLKIRQKASSPGSKKYVLCVGDSLTTDGTWPIEVHRRLTGSGGTPAADGLTNIEFVGTREKSGVNFEGYGGWKFVSYNTANVDNNAKVITCTHDKTAAEDQHSIYKDGTNATWKLETIESGSIKIIAVSGEGNSFPSTGTLTWVSGGVNHSDITYTASENAPGNPFWNSSESKVDFEWYCEQLGISQIDIVYVLLGWNNAGASEAGYKEQAQTFITNVHTAYPNAKIVLVGLEIPARDGLGVNYGATGTYADYYKLMNYVYDIDKWYADLANDNSNVYAINISGQFDTDHNMQTTTVQVNTRNSETMVRQSNGVHPAISGYKQIADAVYRNIHSLL